MPVGLITSVGLRDPYWPAGLCPGEEPGPVLSLVSIFKNASPILFVATRGTKANAYATRRILVEDGFLEDSVDVLETDIDDPTDIDRLITCFDALYKRIKSSWKDVDDWCVCVTTGTPQMQVAWILLACAGRIDAELGQLKRVPHNSEVKFKSMVLGNYSGMLLGHSRGGKNRKMAINAGPREFSGSIIGESPQMKKVLYTADKIAGYDTCVLIEGESGTGKELLARHIHYSSNRRHKPFVPLNCACLNDEILETELFGCKKGAFTGALEDRTGIVAQAAEGTLFLDEVSEMSSRVQTKLLRFLENGEYAPVGSGTVCYADVRVIAASNTALQKLIAKGRFRDDLYHRIATVTIEIPPLRERTGDIELLLNHFLLAFNSRHRKRRRFSSAVLAALLDYEWPGNVRELSNVVTHCCQLAEGDVIQRSELPVRVLRMLKQVKPLKDLIERTEFLQFEAALKQSKSMAAAARSLSIKPHTFRKRLKTKYPVLFKTFKKDRKDSEEK